MASEAILTDKWLHWTLLDPSGLFWTLLDRSGSSPGDRHVVTDLVFDPKPVEKMQIVT